MGRTNPTYRDALRRMEAEYEPFRRALRRRHREAFDELFAGAAEHAAAASAQNATDSRRVTLLAMLVAQQRAIDDLRTRVDDLETQNDDLKTEDDDPQAAPDQLERDGDDAV